MLIKVRTECRSAGQEGIECSTDFAGAVTALKTPILRAGGCGYMHSEKYDAMTMGVKEEQ
jgi:hypothetical protein